MDFELPEELKMIQKLARDFVTDRLRPLERDLLGRAADQSDARAALPAEKEAELTALVREMGLWGVGVPEELGGAGLDTLGACLVEEELSRTVVPFHFGDVTPFLFDGSQMQRERYLQPALSGAKRPLVALLEPGNTGDPAAVRLKARRDGDDYVLNGRKLSFSRPGDDYFALVFAATEAGLTAFLVDKDTPGFTLRGGGERRGWLAPLREPLELAFRNCREMAENVLGEAGKALELGKKWLPARRVIRAARCVGVVRRLLEEATAAAQSLESFGQSVYKKANIRAALAEIAAYVRAARLMVYEAAWQADKGELIARQAALVRLYATQAVQTIADRVSHVFGGPPYLAGQPMARLCQRALADGAVELSLERQRHVVARDIIQGAGD